MLVLGIETATWTAAVGVVRQGEVLSDERHEERSSHAVSLLPLIDRALHRAGVKIQDLDAIAVSVGPGSFTGLRIGLATAKGIHLALGTPLVAVPTLLAHARAIGLDGFTLAPWIDARKREVYAAAYRRDRDAGWVEVVPPAVLPPERAAAAVRADWIVFGTGAWLYRETVQRLVPGVTVLPPERARPSGAAVAIAGTERIRSNGPDDPASLEPDYLRPSEAELGRRQVQGSRSKRS